MQAMTLGRWTGVLVALAAVAALAGVHPTAQQPSTVRGRVSIGIPVASKRPTNTYSRSIQASQLAPVSELRNVVVYLKDAPRRDLAPVRAAIKQEHESFTPRVVAVPVGSTVEFPNADPIYHNVFSLSRPRAFNLGRYPQGQTRSVRFDRPGLVKVFCEIHSHMSASVMVFDHPWFAVPDENGRFELTAMPPGDRQFTAWHERLGDTTLDRRVEPARAAEADFVLPVPQQP
jgi:plastocyanin